MQTTTSSFSIPNGSKFSEYHLRTEIDVNNNVTGDPQGTIVSQPLSFFQGLLPAVTELRLVNTALPGTYLVPITPFFESGDRTRV
ncbi:MAG: hypothetical protein R3B47_06895 [Bacteroidia bacterium]